MRQTLNRAAVFTAAAAAVLAAPLLLGCAYAAVPEDPRILLLDTGPEVQLEFQEENGPTAEPILLAGAGGLAGDKCHRNHKEQDGTRRPGRHWHKAGTSEEAGACVTIDGQTVRQMPEPAAPAADPRDERPDLVVVPAKDYHGLVDEAAELRRDLAAVKSSRDALAAEVRSARARAVAASDTRHVAEQRLSIALEDLRAAEARAAGAGPEVHPRCVRGVNEALDSGWRFTSEEKAALRRACLTPD
ncbi:MAG: hypothetical protein OXC11_14495 [Rhodospirillales bacterium]|nr:hypothetical protein [Rhodospirillales bacterium]